MPRVMVEDVTILSAFQMIQLSWDQNSNSLLNIFTCGQHRDGQHICLNMELKDFSNPSLVICSFNCALPKQ